GAWKGFGVKVIYWLAGLQSLPPDLYEASSLDGASESQQFLYITLPLLVPFLIVITILVTNESFKVFDLVRTFTNGGPYFGTDVVPLYIYSQAFDSTPPQMGYASAGGITFGMATVVVSGLLGLLARRFGMRRSVNLRTNRG
ncbi:MAG TPA: sugar ABC transporter permease, partial [Spirochaetia bacterium]|nr:sugar ABC transporter permease [Spirochaetia bacterium]